MRLSATLASGIPSSTIRNEQTRRERRQLSRLPPTSERAGRRSPAASERAQNWKTAHDPWLEAFVLFNFLCLAGHILLAHASNFFRNRWEHLPVWFSPLAAAAPAIGDCSCACTQERPGLWSRLGIFAAWLSFALGAADVIFHLDSHFFYERTIRSLTYAALLRSL